MAVVTAGRLVSRRVAATRDRHTQSGLSPPRLSLRQPDGRGGREHDQRAVRHRLFEFVAQRLESPFMRRLGIEHPIVQARVAGGRDECQLVAAVVTKSWTRGPPPLPTVRIGDGGRDCQSAVSGWVGLRWPMPPPILPRLLLGSRAMRQSQVPGPYRRHRGGDCLQAVSCCVESHEGRPCRPPNRSRSPHSYRRPISS